MDRKLGDSRLNFWFWEVTGLPSVPFDCRLVVFEKRETHFVKSLPSDMDPVIAAEGFPSRLFVYYILKST